MMTNATATAADSVPQNSTTIPAHVPPEGWRVPLRAAFGGFKGLDWLGFSHNNLNPLLVLYDSEVEVRVLRKQRRAYADVESVDFRLGWRTTLLIIAWRDSGLTFAGNIRGLDALAPADVLREVLRFLESKNVPLSPRAREWLHGGAPDQSPGTAVHAPSVARVSTRLVATAVDLLIFSFVSSIFGTLLFFPAFSLLRGSTGTALANSSWAFPLLCFVTLSALFEASRRKATPGKRLIGLVVCDPDGNAIGFVRAVMRSLVKWALLPVIVAQALLVRLRQPGPLLHDTWTGTRVVDAWSVNRSPAVV